MDESDGIGATVIQTPRRNVRRKLVQSTLLPHKSDDVIEPSGDRKCDAREKEEGEGGDGDLCSSQGKKRRKKRNKASKKDMAKGNSPGKSTPRKNATKNETLAANDHMNVSPSLPNLRLEAKLRAEDQGKDKMVTIVNWTFTEQTSTTWSPHQPIKSDSITHRLKEFDLNEMPALSHPDVCIIDDEEPEQYASQSEGIAAASPVVLISYPEASDKAEVVDCEAHQAVNLSNRVGGAADISHELQSISCRESGQPRNRLWVDKYQPRSASEVCGNTDSVKLMNEWLGQWHERGFQPSKDFLSSDEEKSQDADYKCSESDSDSENTGAEDHLKNVLLIVGPVGSGKSAAIHACAKEQGFKILESNASECRSGAVVRQKFGEALKSYSLSRSLEPLFNSCTDGNGVEDVIEVAPLLHLQNDRANLKPLILFEDVDISFAEDRGLVSAIQQIVEKAKGHVVLTANDKNHGLPDNLERIKVRFSLPSTKELFTHLSSVCTAEEVKFNPGSLEQLAIFCGGNIRKAIMQLQFWFQSKFNRARKAKNTANPYSFDHEAGHALLPKIITRDFPSQLFQYVESEIAKSLSMAEESYNTVEIFVEEVENEKMLNRYWRQGAEKNSIEAKKAAMLRENICVEDYDELEDVLSVPFELSNTSYQAMSFSRSNKRRKLNVVMSSDSDDEPVKETVPLAADPSVPSREELLETSCYQYETSKLSCVNEVSQSVDVSCVPESSYVPETLMDSEAELSPRAVSCGHFDGRVEVSMSEDVAQLKEIYIDRFQSFDCFKNTCETIAESSDGTMMMEDCCKEYLGSSQKMRQVTDKCSRIDFGTTLKTAKKTKLDTVQESWKKLCSSHTDMKPYLDSEPITNLISEADLTCSRYLNLVAMEPTMNVSGDLDTSGYVLEQMTSIVAEQGFSFFTNQIATTVSFPTLSATMVLVVDETKKDHTWSGGSCLDMKPETHLDVLKCERMVQLSSVLESVVPLRSLRGRAFHEYASFIGQISRANPSNLSGVMENSRRQRSRESRHYLSMDLSSEDICMLGSTKHISKR
ncbi:hypothetical protein Bca52824_053222 [Brassica carinata]|uniref:AAA+ ATPase domain-containing protein n=1 Tax=Brassica carinata TaxID=52824 RepID=A0A8X7UKD7_BRACI|nr:hypothetical protein Bca52824_053222 [Brassica carinata]